MPDGGPTRPALSTNQARTGAKNLRTIARTSAKMSQSLSGEIGARHLTAGLMPRYLGSAMMPMSKRTMKTKTPVSGAALDRALSD